MITGAGRSRNLQGGDSIHRWDRGEQPFWFYIYQVRDGETQLVEERKVQPVCDHGDHDEERLVENCRALADCRYILVSRIGYRAAGILEQMGVTPMEIPDLIPAALDRVDAYDQVQRLFD